MMNLNGTLVPDTTATSIHSNRAFKYGDAVFETLKVQGGKIHFFEDHYFRLMASLRVFRIDIPMHFTLEYLENEILTLVDHMELSASARVRITCFRNAEGFYTPTSNEMYFCVECSALQTQPKEHFEIELYKDHYNYSGYLSTLKSTNRAINVLASIFAKENDFDSCILLNERKHICEAISGNIFLIFGSKVVTPPLTEGCLKGIIRKKVIEICSKSQSLAFEERPISPFEIKKADEAFITNSIIGIQSITKYRKKTFEKEQTLKISKQLHSEALSS